MYTHKIQNQISVIRRIRKRHENRGINEFKYKRRKQTIKQRGKSLNVKKKEAEVEMSLRATKNMTSSRNLRRLRCTNSVDKREKCNSLEKTYRQIFVLRS